MINDELSRTYDDAVLGKELTDEEVDTLFLDFGDVIHEKLQVAEEQIARGEVVNGTEFLSELCKKYGLDAD